MRTRGFQFDFEVELPRGASPSMYLQHNGFVGCSGADCFEKARKYKSYWACGTCGQMRICVVKHPHECVLCFDQRVRQDHNGQVCTCTGCQRLRQAADDAAHYDQVASNATMPFNAEPDLTQAPEPPRGARPTILEAAQAVVGPPVGMAYGHAPPQVQCFSPEQAPWLAQPNVAPPPLPGMPRQAVPPLALEVAQLAAAVQNLRLDIFRMEGECLGANAEVRVLNDNMQVVLDQQRRCNATCTALVAAIAALRNLVIAQGSAAQEAAANSAQTTVADPVAQDVNAIAAQGALIQRAPPAVAGQGTAIQSAAALAPGVAGSDDGGLPPTSVSSQEDMAGWECANEEAPLWQDHRSGRQGLDGRRLRDGRTTVSGG